MTVTAAAADGTAEVEVADLGPGVPADERQLIFERFKRGRGSGGKGGFGLGLAIGRELVERMDGELRLVDSEVGARFALLLPLAPFPNGEAENA